MSAWLAKLFEFLFGGKGTTQIGQSNQSATGSTSGDNSPVITAGRDVHLNLVPRVQAEPSTPQQATPELTDEAVKILVEASMDKNGFVLLIRGITGLQLRTNGKHMVNSQDKRSRASWDEAIHQLLARGFLRKQEGEVLAVTEAGFNEADSLRKQYNWH